MDKIPICIDCDHFKYELLANFKCAAKAKQFTDPVTGKVRWNGLESADIERNENEFLAVILGKCGPKGRFFKKKEANGQV